MITPMTSRVRPERADDYADIATVVSAAFRSQVEAQLVDAIRASEHYIPELALVAEVDGRVAGHVMISYATLDTGNGSRAIAMLSPLAVAPEFQRRGAGASLVREATELADLRNEPAVILEGNPAFYYRFGFEPAARYGIEIPVPSWAPPEAGQVLRLSRYHPSLRGKVVYPPAFDDVADDAGT
jgi:putative acetyltransferase